MSSWDSEASATLGSCTRGIQGKSLHNRRWWKAGGTEQSCSSETLDLCSRSCAPEWAVDIWWVERMDLVEKVL